MASKIAIMRVLMSGIAERLSTARDLAADAKRSLDEGEINQALGRSFGLSQYVTEVDAIYQTILAVHRGHKQREDC